MMVSVARWWKVKQPIRQGWLSHQSVLAPVPSIRQECLSHQKYLICNAWNGPQNDLTEAAAQMVRWWLMESEPIRQGCLSHQSVLVQLSHRSVLVAPIRRECQRLDRSGPELPPSVILPPILARESWEVSHYHVSHFSPREMGGMLSHSPSPILVRESWEV